MVSEEEAQRVKQVTRSSDCVSLPTEIEPNFAGWQNLEVNANHSLLKDSASQSKKKTITKNTRPIGAGASSSKIKDPQFIGTTTPKESASQKIQTPKQQVMSKKRMGPNLGSSNNAGKNHHDNQGNSFVV